MLHDQHPLKINLKRENKIIILHSPGITKNGGSFIEKFMDSMRGYIKNLCCGFF
jgi:hypothetical protein